jgi:protoporphyrinogen oxidase
MIKEHKIREITIGGKFQSVDFLINSAPLHLLLDTEKPDFRHLILMTINLNQKPIGDVATYYFPDKRYQFTRVVEPRVRSEKMAPKGKTSLMVEIPVTDFNILDKENLKNEILFQLEEAQFFKKSDVLNVSFFNLPNAYPVLNQSNMKKVDQVLNDLASIKNLKTYGRSGAYSYVHLHDIFKFAKDLIDDYAENR